MVSETVKAGCRGCRGFGGFGVVVDAAMIGEYALFSDGAGHCGVDRSMLKKLLLKGLVKQIHCDCANVGASDHGEEFKSRYDPQQERLVILIILNDFDTGRKNYSQGCSHVYD
jgi:hypothetical protein